MVAFTPVSGLLGGLIIGLATSLLFIGTGRIAGISGIIGGALAPRRGETAWRLAFLIGLFAAGLGWNILGGGFTVELQASTPVMLLAGLLVGFGTRLGSGCTSGHGICGIGRLSPRSITATAVFMVSAGITVFVTRHLVGG